MLGLWGDVSKEAFDRLCDNQHPLTGQQLSPRTRSDRIVGYDVNFHVPKGVSIAYALNHDERILQAFRESVELKNEQRSCFTSAIKRSPIRRVAAA